MSDFKKRIELDAFTFKVFLPTKSVPRGLNVKLSSLRFLREDDMATAQIDNPMYEYDIQGVVGGIQIQFWIANIAEEEEERIDYLIDEDYEMKKLILEVSNGRTTLEDYEILDNTYANVKYKFEETLSPSAEFVGDFFGDFLVNDDNEVDTESIDKIISLATESERNGTEFMETLLKICGNLS